MDNKLRTIIFGLLTIFSVILFLNTGMLIYVGLAVLNLCGALIPIFKSTKLVLLFMFIGLLGGLFSFYHLIMYFI